MIVCLKRILHERYKFFRITNNLLLLGISSCCFPNTIDNNEFGLGILVPFYESTGRILRHDIVSIVRGSVMYNDLT